MASNSGIQIGTSLKNQITDQNFKDNIEDMLMQKSGGKCFLCSKDFNYATDIIHADHDIPISAGGPTDYNNLNLAHDSCNKFKNDNPSLQVKKFLPFRNYLESNPGKFDKVINNFFKIQPKEIVTFLIGADAIQLQFPNGTQTKELTIYEERKPNGHIFKYVFTQVPISSIFNDNVQPRVMKSSHVFKIFQDLHTNPLHEPSSARMQNEPINGGKNKFLMFDGQHKTVAKMLVSDGDKSLIDLKIYLNLSQTEANVLVNTIQAKITKLVLTKSEFAAKMGDEFRDEFEKYEAYCTKNSLDKTEDGFIKFSDKEKQTNNKKTLIQARLNDIIKQDAYDFKILEFVAGSSVLKEKKSVIKETTFINKLVLPLLYPKPLKAPINDDENRITERSNITLILNLFFEHCLQYDQATVSDSELEKIYRLKSQSSLNLFVDLIKKCYDHLLFSSSDPEVLTKKSLNDIKPQLEKAIVNFSKHPIWVQSINKTQKVTNFFNTIQKNGSLIEIADAMKLNLAFLLDVVQIKGDEFD
jgi:hypothetical protein